MQSAADLTCMDCNNEFKSASLLLQHFADHALKHLKTETLFQNKKSKIPHLYPINLKNYMNRNEIDRGSDSGIEDVNPLKFCLVTMEDKIYAEENVQQNNLSKDDVNASSTLKKYQCMYCLKRFGWSTDLKRHILIHTGERPFQCQYCNSSFTRNFLLQKHQRKIHFSDCVNTQLPDLKPISEVINKNGRKQKKNQIKHKSASHVECRNNYVDYRANRLLCSS